MSIVLDNKKRGSVGEFLKENIKKDSTVSIPSSIFTIYAYDELKKVLETTKEVRFLFNEPTFIKKIIANQKDVKEFLLLMKQREKNVSEFSLEIGLKNNLDQNQVASRCYNFVDQRASVKSVLKPGVFT